MASKTIAALTLRGDADATLSFPVDDGIQTYRVTMPQIWTYLSTLIYTARTISAASNALVSTDRIVFLDPTSAGFTQLLPAVAGFPVGFTVILKNIATNGNVVTLDADSTELIDNAQTLDLQSDPTMEGVTLYNNGTKWLIL